MKITKTLCVITVFSVLAMPLMAAPKVIVTVPNPPAHFGEGGGSGAAQVPEDFVLDESLIDTGDQVASEEIISAETVTGILKVKGKGSKVRFFLKPVKAKKIELSFDQDFVEKAEKMNKKEITVTGFMVNNNFLVVKVK